MTFSKKQLTAIAIHVLIWVAITLLPLLFKPSEVIFNIHQLQGIYLHLVFTILVFYISYSLIIPLFFYRKKITITLVLLMLASILGSLGLGYSRPLLIDNKMHANAVEMRKPIKPDSNRKPRKQLKKARNRRPIYDNIFFFLLISGAALSIRATQKWMQEESDRKSLEIDKATIELAWLKNQVSPHFFFNTLNNIHSLIESNPAIAQKSVHQLSKLMRYLLYESNTELISLKKEVSFIDNYMGLMKLKLTEDVNVSFSYPDFSESISVPPLLFNPLIENAFKFGVTYQADSFIKIDLHVDDDKILLMVENSISKNETQKEHSGIGLANLKQRLDLLYKTSYSFGVEETLTTYKVELRIPIKA